MMRSRYSVVAAVWFGWGLATAAHAAEPAVEELVALLRTKGVLEEAEGERILARSAQRDSAPPPPAFLEKLQLFADVRARAEGFYFDRDALEEDADDRVRLRYRLRFGLLKGFGERTALGLRLSSNTGDPRSGNLTIGGNPDFEPDELRIDRAFLRLDLPQTDFGLRTRLLAGRTENPFRWNIGADSLVWDPDVSLEGGSLLWSMGEAPLRLFLNGGAYTIEEQADGSDPSLYGLQLGALLPLRSALALGLRVSNYDYRSLDAGFVERATAEGNLPSAFDDRRAHVGEAGAYLNWTASPRWPLALWVSGAHNFTAERAELAGDGGEAIRVGAENDAIAFGLEFGSPSQLVQLGIGMFRIEANAVIAQFIDSDLSDGLTNVQGYYAFAARQLRPGLELRLWFSDTDSLRDSGGAAGPFATSLAGRDRLRVQADLMATF